MKKARYGAFIIGTLLTLLPLFFISGCNVPSLSQNSTAIITEFVDGDTIRAQGFDNSIRVLCVDFIDIKGNKPDGRPRIEKWTVDYGIPEEKVKNCYKEGIDRLNTEFLNKGATFETDMFSDDKDKYGRYLRYVQLYNGEYLEKWIIEQGYADFDYDIPLSSKCQEWKALALQVRENHQGCLWKS